MSGLTDALAAGDLLQSAASRMAEYLRDVDEEYPYEVEMAILEAEGAIKEWTEARRGMNGSIERSRT